MKNILIAGGTGLVGQILSQKLIENNYRVAILSRSASQNESNLPYFQWNIAKKEIDPAAIDFADIVINLAGAGIADQKWTAARKHEILQSRVNSNQFLFETFKDKPLQMFVSASATGYYGGEYSDSTPLTETDKPGTDFMSQVCISWEESAQLFQNHAPLAIVRIGVVLDKNGGMLAKLAPITKIGLGAPLGSGNQYVPWIHAHDLAGIFLHILANNLTGQFNAVAPQIHTNKAFSKTMAQVFNRPFIAPKVPSLALKAILGEMSAVVLKGSNISSKKIQDTGFVFSYGNLENALKNIYEK